MNMMGSNSPDLTLIPQEVLSHIFAFLHIEDRKSVRLVCRVWNECCNCLAIVKNEMFCFRTYHSMESIDSFLRDCSQFRATIAFQGVPLNRLPKESTWQMIGERIHSLSLTESTVSDETIRNIILYCENMHSFKFSSTHLNDECTYYNRFCSRETLDELIQMKVERRKLTLLHLNIDAKEIGADNLEKIFKIFPCIRTLDVGHSSYPWCTSYYGTLHGTFNPALIKELSFNVLSNGAWLQELANNNQIKLQKLEIMISETLSAVPMDVLRQLWYNQSDLRILRIEFPKWDKGMLLEILENCSNLVDFRCRIHKTSSNWCEYSEVLQKILKSNLECVMIWPLSFCDFAIKATFDDNLFKPLTNKTVHTLRLDLSRNLPDECVCQILKHFRGLRHLYIGGDSTNKIFQTIFQYHIHLKTLVFLRLDLLALNGTAYSVSRLRELVHLELASGSLSAGQLENIIQNFDFPRLKYLRLSLWKRNGEMNLNHLPTGTPSLEVLSASRLSLHMDQLEYLCKKLPRLSSVNIHHILLDSTVQLGVERSETLADLFIMRPSLKYIVEHRYGPYGRYYLYDRFTNIVHQKDYFSDKPVIYLTKENI